LHGDVEAAAQVGEGLDGLQAPSGFWGEVVERGREEVAEGFAVTASYASSKLVQVAQAKLMGVVDDHRVGVGNVHARFDDAGTD